MQFKNALLFQILVLLYLLIVGRKEQVELIIFF